MKKSMEIFIFIAVANKSLLILDIFARMSVKIRPFGNATCIYEFTYAHTLKLRLYDVLK